MDAPTGTRLVILFLGLLVVRLALYFLPVSTQVLVTMPRLTTATTIAIATTTAMMMLRKRRKGRRRMMIVLRKYRSRAQSRRSCIRITSGWKWGAEWESKEEMGEEQRKNATKCTTMCAV